MALKRNHEIQAAFSMASMTDVIFLLLVFFMVTSTYIFPTAIEVNLPEGVEQSPEKPGTRVYVDTEGQYFVSIDEADPIAVPKDSLAIVLMQVQNPDSTGGIAVYADSAVAYGKVVEVLNLGAANQLKMVLATRPGSTTPPVQTPAIDNVQ